jgi:hypothetical protein
MSVAGKHRMKIKDEYINALGASSAEVSFVWRGIDGTVTIQQDRRHISTVSLRAVGQEICAMLPSGDRLRTSPLALLAVSLLAGKLRVAQIEDDKYYARLEKFDATDYASFN